MVSLEPIWKDPHDEIAKLAAEREVRGVKKELRERVTLKSDSKPESKSKRGISMEPSSKAVSSLNKTST